MTPHLLLHPGVDKPKALTGVPNRKVLHPAPQDRVDHLNHPLHGLGLKAAEEVFEFAQQRGPLAQLGRIGRPPLPLQTPHPAKFKAENSEAFPFAEVHQPTLLGIQLDLDFSQFLAQPLLEGLEQPVMAGIRID
jgi:hypothetical protein